MKQIAACGFVGECPRVYQLDDGSYRIVGIKTPLDQTVGLNLEADERVVDLPKEVMQEAARVIIRELAQDGR